MKIAQITRIEDGILAGTEIEFVMGFLAVKYPHRKSKDLYVPPMKCDAFESKTFCCCREGCQQPDIEGTMDALVKHLELHAGRLFKKLNPVTKTSPAIIVVSLPPNPWAEDDNRGANPDRRFTVKLYMDLVQRALEKQGIGVKQVERPEVLA